MKSFLNEYPHSTNVNLAISRFAELTMLKARNTKELDVWLRNQENPVYSEIIGYLHSSNMNVFNEGMESYLISLIRSNDQFWIETVQNEFNRRELSGISNFITVNGSKKFSNNFISSLRNELHERERKHWKVVVEDGKILDFIDYYLMYHYESFAIVKGFAEEKMLKWINLVPKIIEYNQIRQTVKKPSTQFPKPLPNSYFEGLSKNRGHARFTRCSSRTNPIFRFRNVDRSG
jgi:hypothetical protein